MVNTKPEQVEEESEEVREQKHKTFVEKYEKQIKHFGELGAGLHLWGPRGLRVTGAGSASGAFQQPVNTLSQACSTAGMTVRSTCQTTPTWCVRRRPTTWSSGALT